jgi:signal transduction histidine kinase
MKSPIVEVFQRLFYAPDPDGKHIANRIRVMERDIGVTIKIIVLSILGYYLFQNSEHGLNVFQTLSADSSGLALETVRGAFVGYCVLNFVVICSLLAMTWVPLGTIQWTVFIMNLTDAVFVAILVNLTGGLESTFYWVFLFLIIRNSISVPQHRYQLLLNALVVVCFIFSPVIGATLQNVVEQLDQPTTLSVPVAEQIANQPAVQADTNFVRQLTNRVTASTNDPAGTNRVRRTRTVNLETEELSWSDALLAAMYQLTDPKRWQSNLTRIVLLALLMLCCYGISVLWNYQLHERAEEAEFASRQHQLRSTGRLAAEIAHRLKNPLAIINNAVFSLKRALPEAPEKVTGKLEMIQEEVDRSDQILTELMGYAKLADAKVERLNINHAIEQAADDVFPEGYEHDIEISIVTPEMPPPVLMQRLHLSEILVNLLTNARSVLEGRGKLDIEVAVHQGENLTVTIADNGPGMPHDEAQRIFDAFYSNTDKGTGLGLAIVRHNVEIYGGRVEVDSKLGSGTTFTLVFPFKATAPQQS